MNLSSLNPSETLNTVFILSMHPLRIYSKVFVLLEWNCNKDASLFFWFWMLWCFTNMGRTKLAAIWSVYKCSRQNKSNKTSLLMILFNFGILNKWELVLSKWFRMFVPAPPIRGSLDDMLSVLERRGVRKRQIKNKSFVWRPRPSVWQPHFQGLSSSSCLLSLSGRVGR